MSFFFLLAHTANLFDCDREQSDNCFITLLALNLPWALSGLGVMRREALSTAGLWFKPNLWVSLLPCCYLFAETFCWHSLCWVSLIPALTETCPRGFLPFHRLVCGPPTRLPSLPCGKHLYRALEQGVETRFASRAMGSWESPWHLFHPLLLLLDEKHSWISLICARKTCCG